MTRADLEPLFQVGCESPLRGERRTGGRCLSQGAKFRTNGGLGTSRQGLCMSRCHHHSSQRPPYSRSIIPSPSRWNPEFAWFQRGMFLAKLLFVRDPILRSGASGVLQGNVNVFTTLVPVSVNTDSLRWQSCHERTMVQAYQNVTAYPEMLVVW